MINPKWADHGFDPLTQSIRAHTQSKRRAAFSGITVEEFKKLKIPNSVMKEGILFIWIEKELMYEIIVQFEA